MQERACAIHRHPRRRRDVAVGGGQWATGWWAAAEAAVGGGAQRRRRRACLEQGEERAAEGAKILVAIVVHARRDQLHREVLLVDCAAGARHAAAGARVGRAGS
eukprot:78111-Prymnesium_polylepis.1